MVDDAHFNHIPGVNAACENSHSKPWTLMQPLPVTAMRHSPSLPKIFDYFDLKRYSIFVEILAT